MSDDIKGLGLGFVGVAIFSVTLPVTRIALTGFDAVTIGLGRAVIAAAVAAVILAVTRQPWPRQHWKKLLVVGLCVVVGFPLFASIAMESVHAAHGGVVLGVLPLATSAASALICGERPSLGFWLLALTGSALVVGFAILQGAGALVAGDWWLLAAVVCAGTGYAIGGELSRHIGSWQVICWALVVTQPVIVLPVLWVLPGVAWQASVEAWAAFLYVALFSQLIGFFAWNRGLALGGVARVSQVQLLQLFMTLGFAALLAGETVDAPTLAFAFAVVATVAVGRRMPVRRAG